MKRRIDITQLQELTDEQKQKLREWWKPQEGDFYYCIKNNHTYLQMMDLECLGLDIKNKYLPILDISQMIELLLEKNIPTAFEPGDLKQQEVIVDALWEAVKTIL